jgi:predicted nucleotidyltransferase
MEDETKTAERFAEALREELGEGLRSVVLYGSAARREFRELHSDLNLLVLVRALDGAGLRSFGASARRWSEAGNPPPLVMEWGEFRASADVFPIEFADLLEARRVLVGEDPMIGLAVDAEHLRLQCERELKGKQLQLRERFLLCADDPEALGELLVRSTSTFLALFRAALRVADVAVPGGSAEVVRAVGARAAFDPDPVLELIAAREGGPALRPAADAPLVDGYLEAIAAVVRLVDSL